MNELYKEYEARVLERTLLDLDLWFIVKKL